MRARRSAHDWSEADGSETTMVNNWDDIEAIDGFAGVRRRVEQDVRPMIEGLPPESLEKTGVKSTLQRSGTWAFFLFVAAFAVISFVLPDVWWGIALQFILFPTLFFGAVALMLWLNREELMGYIVRAGQRFQMQAAAWRALLGPLELTYVAAPGQVPYSLKWIGMQAWAPRELREMVAHMQEETGMADAVASAKAAGFLMPEAIVIGSQKQKEVIANAQMERLEDGFYGHRAGLKFEMFEWAEPQDEAPDKHHLIIVLDAPLRLMGITELRARKLFWLDILKGENMQPVDLGAKAFTDAFRLKSTDQTEARALFNPLVMERVIALAHGGDFRAVAKGGHLVFDFVGENRFDLIDLTSGAWDDDKLFHAVRDLAEALELVDALGHAFMVRRAEG